MRRSELLYGDEMNAGAAQGGRPGGRGAVQGADAVGLVDAVTGTGDHGAPPLMSLSLTQTGNFMIRRSPSSFYTAWREGLGGFSGKSSLPPMQMRKNALK